MSPCECALPERQIAYGTTPGARPMSTAPVIVARFSPAAPQAARASSSEPNAASRPPRPPSRPIVERSSAVRSTARALSLLPGREGGNLEAGRAPRLERRSPQEHRGASRGHHAARISCRRRAAKRRTPPTAARPPPERSPSVRKTFDRSVRLAARIAALAHALRTTPRSAGGSDALPVTRRILPPFLRSLAARTLVSHPALRKEQLGTAEMRRRGGEAVGDGGDCRRLRALTAKAGDDAAKHQARSASGETGGCCSAPPLVGAEKERDRLGVRAKADRLERAASCHLPGGRSMARGVRSAACELIGVDGLRLAKGAKRKRGGGSMVEGRPVVLTARSRLLPAKRWRSGETRLHPASAQQEVAAASVAGGEECLGKHQKRTSCSHPRISAAMRQRVGSVGARLVASRDAGGKGGSGGRSGGLVVSVSAARRRRSAWASCVSRE